MIIGLLLVVANLFLLFSFAVLCLIAQELRGVHAQYASMVGSLQVAGDGILRMATFFETVRQASPSTPVPPDTKGAAAPEPEGPSAATRARQKQHPWN